MAADIQSRFSVAQHPGPFGAGEIYLEGLGKYSFVVATGRIGSEVGKGPQEYVLSIGVNGGIVSEKRQQEAKKALESSGLESESIPLGSRIQYPAQGEVLLQARFKADENFKANAGKVIASAIYTALEAYSR